MNKFYEIFGLITLYSWMSCANACHNAFDGSIDAIRQKRQTRVVDNVERTENLREFFSTCLMERAGPMFDWNGVVDFAILDTLWYEVTDGVECSNDTVLCWQERLEAFLRPNSVVLPFARECIRQLGEEVRTGRYEGRRSKRSYYSYHPATTQSPEDLLMARYSLCIRRRLTTPRNRREINIKSLVEFIEKNAICGECSEIRLPSYASHHGYHTTKRSKRTTNQISKRKYSVRSLVSSLSLQFSSANLSAYNEKERSSTLVYPFIFQGLTLATSPLFNPILSCNQIFMDQFLSNPCDGLRNRKKNSFCEMQQSWCINFPQYMNLSCQRSCCERLNMPITGLPSLGWTEWTPWGACPAPCGRKAIQVRKRSCPLGAPGVSPCNGKARETRVCQPEGCSYWSGWSSWSSCQVTCGGQTQISRRRCINGRFGDIRCTGMHTRAQICAREKCPGVWTKWGSWSNCPVTCGGSNTYMQRTRSCLNGRAGGRGCKGFERERQECGRDYCPPQWSEWSSWSECSFRRRIRHCSSRGSRDLCQGDSIVYERCEGCGRQMHPPPATTHHAYPSPATKNRRPHNFPAREIQTASWTSWSNWSTCKGNCVYAIQQRKRECQHTRRPKSSCNGRSKEIKRCITFKCLFYGK